MQKKKNNDVTFRLWLKKGKKSECYDVLWAVKRDLQHSYGSLKKKSKNEEASRIIETTKRGKNGKSERNGTERKEWMSESPTISLKSTSISKIKSARWETRKR